MPVPDYMKDPTAVMLKFYPIGEAASYTFQRGRMAMALEVISVVRTLEEIPVLDEGAKAAVVSAFETLLVQQGLADAAYELYDRLCGMRRLNFQPEPLLGAEPARNADAERADGQDPSSSRGAPGGELLQRGRSLSSLEERRSLGDDATFLQGEPPDAAGIRRRIG